MNHPLRASSVPNSLVQSLLRAPRSPSATLALILLACLALAPFVLPGSKQLDVAAKILVFALLVASYDLLLGYSGIVSFAHTMFFGIGAYGIAIASTAMGPGWAALGTGCAAALALSFVFALLLGVISLRLSAIYFAMISLALSTAFATYLAQLSHWSGGDDGLTFSLPGALSPSGLAGGSLLGVPLNGRLVAYYGIFCAVCCGLYALRRIVNSPFGKVMEVIRENSIRVEALGLQTFRYRVVANIVGALLATLAGCLSAIWLRYTGPDTALSTEIMLDVLLILVIGGMGTIHGAVVGAAVLLMAQNYLKDLVAMASQAVLGVFGLAPDGASERWMLWLGVLFILCLYYFPEGIAGRLDRLRMMPFRSRAGASR